MLEMPLEHLLTIINIFISKDKEQKTQELKAGAILVELKKEDLEFYQKNMAQMERLKLKIVQVNV